MPLSALVLVVVAAVLHATWNLAAKRSGASGLIFIWWVSSLSSLMWAVPALAVYGELIPSLSLRAWQAVATSAVIHVLYFTVLLQAYRQADLSVVYPVARGTGPLLAALAALPFLGEVLSAGAWLGLALVVGGTFTIAGGDRIMRGASDAATMRGVGWGALTGLTIAVYTVNDGHAVRHLGVPPLLYDWLATLGRVVILAPFAWVARRRLGETLRADWRVAALMALLAPASYMLALWAMTLAPVSRIAPARELSMLVAALCGAKLLGEPDMWRRLAGAGLIAGGVAALSLSP